MAPNIRFLVVDDFPTMRRLIGNILADLGYVSVAEADDGRTALPILKAGMVDFLITDWNMPGMSGLELLREVRKEAATRHIPVLMVTAEAKHDQIAEARRSGVNGYVIKPFGAQALRKEIDAILHNPTTGPQS